MRWIWIDCFVEFVSGQRASALKNLTLAEDHLHDHFPGFPVMPASLMIEGVAQTAGILLGETRNFQEPVILAKIRRAEFDGFAVPGDQLRYDVVLESHDERGGLTSGAVLKDGTPLGRVDLVFSHLDRIDKRPDIFSHQFLDILNAFRRTSAPVP